MIEDKKLSFRWGPIPGYLINVDAWRSIFLDYPRRPHHYVWPDGYEIFKNGKMLFVNGLGPLEKTGGEMFRKIILSSRRKRFVRLWQTRVRSLFSFCGQFPLERLGDMPDIELARAWRELNGLIFAFWEPGVIPEMAAYGAEAILKQALMDEGLDERRRTLALSYLSAPVRPSFYQEEEIALLKVASRFGKKDFSGLLKRHQQRFFWIGNSYGAVQAMPEAYFLNRIKILLKKNQSPVRQISGIYRYLEMAKAGHRRSLTWVKRKRLIKKISDGLAYCIWWQDQRKGYIFQYLHYLTIFSREFARRNKISSTLYRMAWSREIRLHPAKSLLRNLESRRRLYAVHYDRNNFHALPQAEAKKIHDALWRQKLPLDRVMLRGTVVFPSSQPLYGTISIVRHHGDLARFPAGRIMVTSMTAPEYISAIRKAKAIIADEGGLTCHAAIVSRELKVPCIVGTKIATQVLKDGDRVEVDATKGVVRKIG